ncbi:MAG: ABC transporter ATP-binding protein [Akkermansia sp.]|uniref:ABC transporter ATP-binding protein n=1 Tax=Akkermansia sp. TaxID=1872421 RepID=UPI0025B80A30|nr:ATP-binding cassette domain-containing protein [Akkermansia sp.]MBS5508256.1 ABC transporter ATP-binding protein [Akkermansia sp.]
MNSDILSIHDISLSFVPDTSSDAPTRILDGLSLNVPRGRITALIGGNGSGKTTLFNIISGLQKSSTGKIWLSSDGSSPPIRIDGYPPAKIPRLGIGRLFQDRQLFPTLSLLENFTVAAGDFTGEFPFSCLASSASLQRSEADREARARTILEKLFGPNNKYFTMLDAPGNAFSFGEQRLFSLARLLMPDNTCLLLLDEPTSGVNPTHCNTIASILPNLVHEFGLSVILIEHNMTFVSQIADYCAYLSGGKIAAFGTTDEILNLPAVRAIYLGLESPFKTTSL